MKKNELLILLFVIFNQQVFAQATGVDSLKKELERSLADTNKADIALQICLFYQEDKADSALYYVNYSLNYALHSNDLLRKGKALHQKGVSFDYKNNLDSCLFYLKEAEAIYLSLGLIDKQSNAISDFGMAYYYRGNYEIALRNYLRALVLRQKVGDKRSIAKSMNNIGLVYRARKDYTNAIKYYFSSLAIKKEIKDEPGIMNTMINIGSAYQRSGIYDSAYYYAGKAEEIAEKLNDRKNMISCKANMGAALASLHKFDESKKILLVAEKDALTFDFKADLPTIYESLGSISFEKKNISSAIMYFNKGLQLLQIKGSKESMAIFYKTLSTIYKEKGDFENALINLEKSKALYDTLMNIENSRQINEMSAVYETGEKEKEIEKLQLTNEFRSAELNLRKKQRNYFILSTVLFIGLAGFAYRAFTSNRKKKNQLNLQNVLIEKSLFEKEILLKEIHHRVKNNLQIVSSLLSLQSNYISDEKALDAVRESKNRVQSMAIIHQNLYQDESLVNIDVKEYVEQLVAYLFHTYNLHDSRIQLEMDIQPMRLDVDILVPLGLVINELVSNCLKYAFPDHKSGKIKVLFKVENGTLKLAVYDNGIGIQGNEPHFNQNTFGFKMVHAFVKKLKGDLEIVNEDGTKVDIEIRNYKTGTL